MFRLPSLEYTLSHPHPKGHWFLLATIILFMIMLPLLILINIVTLGFDLVPSLQPRFQPNNTYLEAWWGTRRLPPLLRPRPPPCQPRELGRGDNFRVSGQLFDYTVLSAWNTSQPSNSSSSPDQERLEYRGDSLEGCYVNRARYDYSLNAQTNSITVGVFCPGNSGYRVQLSMQTTITYAVEVSADFVGQYFGPRLDLLGLLNLEPTNYRKVVLATLGVIGTDATTIMRQPLLSNPPLNMRVVFNIEDNSPELLPNVSSLTYANGSQPNQFPEEALIYVDTIYNLAVVTVDAVNLDLRSNKFSNIFTNATRATSGALGPNLPPTGVTPSNWAQTGVDFYYGAVPSPYQTWAQALIDGNPVKLGNVTGLPTESVMAASYLCPSYRVKPARSLLASVFVGSATMTLSVWGAWMVLTTFLARQIMAPQVICHCRDCEARREREADEKRRRELNPVPGTLERFLAPLRRKKQPKPTDEEDRPASIHIQALDWTPGQQPSSAPLEAHRPSYTSNSSGKEKQ